MTPEQRARQAVPRVTPSVKTDMGTISVLDETGFAAVPGVLGVDQCAEMVTALDGAGSGRAGCQNLLDVAACQRFAAVPPERSG